MAKNISQHKQIHGNVSGAPSAPVLIISTVPLGTIVPSMLDFDDFQHSLELKYGTTIDPQFNARVNEWAPCDGRDISSSDLAGYIAAKGFEQQKAPDLRGKFLRGLNDSHTEDAAIYFDPLTQGNPDAVNGNVPFFPGQYQHDAINGKIKMNMWTEQCDRTNDNGVEYCGQFQGSNPGDAEPRRLELRDITVNESYQIANNIVYNKLQYIPDPVISIETRPRNISVFFYIKINDKPININIQNLLPRTVD